MTTTTTLPLSIEPVGEVRCIAEGDDRGTSQTFAVSLPGRAREAGTLRVSAVGTVALPDQYSVTSDRLEINGLAYAVRATVDTYEVYDHSALPGHRGRSPLRPSHATINRLDSEGREVWGGVEPTSAARGTVWRILSTIADELRDGGRFAVLWRAAAEQGYMDDLQSTRREMTKAAAAYDAAQAAYQAVLLAGPSFR